MNDISAREQKRTVQQLYDEYRLYIYKHAWKYCSETVHIDDLVQEVWVNICANPDRVLQLPKPQLMAYLLATVKNTAYSLARNTPADLPLEAIDGLSYNETDILNAILDRRLSINEFHRIWPCVPAQARELLERKYFLEESDSEIAQALGIRSSSVRMYLSRARKTALSVLDAYRDLIR